MDESVETVERLGAYPPRAVSGKPAGMESHGGPGA
jgi:hypothetical protein